MKKISSILFVALSFLSCKETSKEETQAILSESNEKKKKINNID